MSKKSPALELVDILFTALLPCCEYGMLEHEVVMELLHDISERKNIGIWSSCIDLPPILDRLDLGQKLQVCELSWVMACIYEGVNRTTSDRECQVRLARAWFTGREINREQKWLPYERALLGATDFVQAICQWEEQNFERKSPDGQIPGVLLAVFALLRS